MGIFFAKYQKNILIFLSFLLGILLIPSMIFVVSNIFFYFGKYEISQKINTTLGEIFPYNQNLLLKQADYFYEKKDYQTALLYYLGITCKNEKACFLLGHNLGNTYYRFGELQEERDIKRNFWMKSLESYSQALKIKNDEETQMNYDFVRKKLEELEEEKQEEQEEQQQQEETPPEQEDEEENNQQEETLPEQEDEEENNQQEETLPEQEDEEEQQENSQENQPNSGEEGQEDSSSQPQPGTQDSQEEESIPTSQNPNFGLGGDEQEGFTPLTPEERQMILDQLERLEQEELQNRELNKPGNRNNFFDQFGIERFFQNRTNQDW